MKIDGRLVWLSAASAALFMAIACPAKAGDEFVWNAERPLRWQDFAGPVPKHAPHANVAVTAASLRWSYSYSLEWSQSACVYRITSIHTDALFDPHVSWVRPDGRTAAVLAHEQGHFDIAEIHKRMFEVASQPYLGARAACKGRDKRSVAKFVEHDIDAKLGKIYERIWTNQNRVQATYDTETAHGMNAAVQKDWLVKIAAGLRGRGWDELGPAGAGRANERKL
jgi:hypothetical protein